MPANRIHSPTALMKTMEINYKIGRTFLSFVSNYHKDQMFQNVLFNIKDISKWAFLLYNDLGVWDWETKIKTTFSVGVGGWLEKTGLKPCHLQSVSWSWRWAWQWTCLEFINNSNFLSALKLIPKMGLDTTTTTLDNHSTLFEGFQALQEDKNKHN